MSGDTIQLCHHFSRLLLLLLLLLVLLLLCRSTPLLASLSRVLNRFLKLSFHSVSDLMEVRRALMPTIQARGGGVGGGVPRLPLPLPYRWSLWCRISYCCTISPSSSLTLRSSEIFKPARESSHCTVQHRSAVFQSRGSPMLTDKVCTSKALLLIAA